MKRIKRILVGKVCAANQKGFSLIEVMVVLAIILVLAAILLPALVRAKKMAEGVPDVAKMKELYEALIMYRTDDNDIYPLTYNLIRPYTGSDQIFGSDLDNKRERLKDGNWVADPFYQSYDCSWQPESKFKMSFAYMRNVVQKDDYAGFLELLETPNAGLFADPFVGDEHDMYGIPGASIGLNCGLNVAQVAGSYVYGPIFRIQKDGSLYILQNCPEEKTILSDAHCFYFQR